MNRDDLSSIREKLKKNLSSKRYEHTLGVAYTSACLAMRYGADQYRAELAGLLHDCAKEYKDRELPDICAKSGFQIGAEERQAPQVLHAIYGPYLAKTRYGVTDAEVLDAIRWHTTGKPDMTLLEKIVFVADYIEPNRYKSDNLPVVRPLAFADLTACVYRITEDTLAYLKQRGYYIDRMTESCCKWLKENGTHDI